ncbi:kinase-like domain-containing protein [Dimargaris cristalligena]|uniref:Kinase-like domain-containing protein n=1 Tax=Dimargaris cristalligena TaxID=215637 RepID=A0A4P9ZRU3_9FUNG|nr:kinase-like domain-containing protein [Dimargaris cristalligena]|eukprot:RKP35372.1 kinase-like domain-containing protein [Dimargaris cristalligena]
MRTAEPANHSWDNSEGHYIVVPGQDFTDRFSICSQLGQGTFGRVIECYDKVNKSKCAIKIIRSIQKYREAASVEIRVLNRIREKDPNNTYRCIHLREHFEHLNHVCMVFDLMGSSVFDFLKSNDFHAFAMREIQHFAIQLIRAVSFLHRLNLIHTDLKPENILLVQTDSYLKPSLRDKNGTTKVLKNTDIRLIDFGSATFQNEFHSSVVSTRHYRAPEIIMGIGWSYPCDMWSIGCILMEFLTGDALFQTHDNAEHLAMMERVLGHLPSSSSAKRMFNQHQLIYPTPETKPAAIENVKQMRTLEAIVGNESNQVYAQFLNLVKGLLTFDPRQRLTADEALNHPFLRLPLNETKQPRYIRGLPLHHEPPFGQPPPQQLCGNVIPIIRNSGPPSDAA